MNNFSEIKINFVEKLAYKRREYITLIKIITGYANTDNRLFKMGLIDSPACKCGFEPQNINYLF